MRHDEHGGDLATHPGVVLDFSVSLNPLGMPVAVRDVLSAWSSGAAAYPDPYCRDLRRGLAEFHDLNPAAILCGNGASDLIHRVCSALEPDRVLTVAPAFSEYERSARVAGAEVTYYHLSPDNDFLVDGGFVEAITDQIDLVFVCQPNNPTGRLIAPEVMERLIDRVRQTDAHLVIDECFLDFTEAESLMTLAQTDSHIIVIRALTKSHCLAGLRLGYAVARPDQLARLAEHGPRWSVSAPAQVAGLAGLLDNEWLAKTRFLVDLERAFMTGGLAELGLRVVPAAASYLLFQSSTDLFRPLLDRGMMIRACANFIGLDETWWRIGLKTRAENLLLLTALREILHG